MKCSNHPELEASAFCRECGKPMCAECQRPALGSVYCAEHVPAMAGAPPEADPFRASPPPPPYTPPPPPNAPPPATGPMFPNSPYSAASAPRTGKGPNPALAFLLGFLFPGVGAIYNGQYAKGLVHAVIFGVLVSLLNGNHNPAEPLLAIFLAIWIFYMAFEAFHTAKKRRMGIHVDEFSSVMELKPVAGRFPAGAIILIGIGFVLLMDTTGLIPLEYLERFWPLGLILLGFYLLYNRCTPAPRIQPPASSSTASNPSNFPGAGI